MGERTRVVVMSRAQAHCCRLTSAPLCKSTEVHGTGGRVSAILLRRWVLLSTAQSHGVVARSFPRACPSLAALLSCAHRRVTVAHAVVREREAKRQQRRRRSDRGWLVGRWCYEEESRGAQVAFFSVSARLGAFSFSVGNLWPHYRRATTTRPRLGSTLHRAAPVHGGNSPFCSRRA